MLRWILGSLLALNAVYFAWTHAWLAWAGLAPTDPSEPAHVQSQVKPETMRLLNPKEAKAIESVSRKPPECLQSDFMNDAQAQALRTKLETASPPWPAGSWSLDKFSDSGVWMVFMGPYPHAQALEKKRQELRKINVSFENHSDKTYGEGLILSQSPSKPAMDKQLQDLSKAGVRTARVLALRPQASGMVLKLPAVTEDMRPLVDSIRPLLPSTSTPSLRKCSA